MNSWKSESRTPLTTPIVIAGAIILVVATTNPSTFLSAGNIQGALGNGGVQLPMILGEALVLIVGGLDISVGSVMAMSGALVTGFESHGPFVGVATALAFGAFIGLVNGILVVKVRIAAFIATLGTMTLVRGLLLTYTGQESQVLVDPGLRRLGAGWHPLMLAIMTLLVVGFVLSRTRLGRHWYAIGTDHRAAFLNGVPADREKILAFVLSGTFAAWSGVLLTARLTTSSVQVGVGAELFALTAVIIGGASLRGGRGSASGAAVGLLALVVLTNGMNLAGVTTYHQIGVQALLLVTVVSMDALGARGLNVAPYLRSLASSRRATDATR